MSHFEKLHLMTLDNLMLVSKMPSECMELRQNKPFEKLHLINKLNVIDQLISFSQLLPITYTYPGIPSTALSGDVYAALR